MGLRDAPLDAKDLKAGGGSHAHEGAKERWHGPVHECLRFGEALGAGVDEIARACRALG